MRADGQAAVRIHRLPRGRSSRLSQSIVFVCSFVQATSSSSRRAVAPWGWCSSPCFGDVRHHRSRCRRDPRRLQSRGRVVGRYRVAPAVPRSHRQREGAGVRPEHRRVDATASPASPGDRAASPQGQLATRPTAGSTASYGQGCVLRRCRKRPGRHTIRGGRGSAGHRSRRRGAECDGLVD